MDLAFASLAKIRILLLPVGSVSRSIFSHWQEEFKTFDEIRLSDVPADNRDDRARFMPSPLASGSLYLSFTRHTQSSSRAQLDLFRPSDSPLGVIGIASCSQADSLSTIYSQFTGSLAELFPSSSMFPLAQNCFVFEEGDGNTNLNIGSHLPGLVVIPSMMGNKKLYVGTLLAELCSNVLGEFSLIVNALESSLGSESLSTGLFARLPEYKSSRHQLVNAHSLDQASTNSAPDLAISTANEQAKISIKRASTLNPNISGHQSRNTAVSTSQNRSRQSMISSGSAHARLYKTLGDLFLLAGRTMDASIWYSEAVHQLTRPQDMAWLAASLEGIVVTSVVEAWASNRSSETAESKEVWMEHSEKLLRAASLYASAVDVAGGEEYLPELSALYVEVCLRHSSLLYSIWKASGWNSFCFDLLRGESRVHRLSYPENRGGPSANNAKYHKAVIGISRSDISGALAQAHGPWLLHLYHRDRIEMLSRVSSMYAGMQYKRREAYTLREILACLMDLVVQGREEARMATELQTSVQVPVKIDNQGCIGIRENDAITGNDSLLKLVKYICDIHSVDLDSVAFADEAPNVSESYKAAAKPSAWTDLQVGLVREAIAVAEALPDYAAVSLLALSALRSLYRSLDADDQYHFFTSAARAMATMRRRGDERRLRYWLDEIVSNISFIPLSWVRVPVERPLSDLQAQDKGDGEQLEKLDPFLYNPRQSIISKDSVAVANEEIGFLVQLENPYSFTLEISSMDLSTTGVPFVSNPVQLEIPPNSSEIVTLTGRAATAGTLLVRGCSISLPGIEAHEILLPVLSEEETEKRLLKIVADMNEAARTKYSILSDRLDKKRESIGLSSGRNSRNMVAPKHLTLKIIPEQPNMSIRRTSLTNGAVMLYEGETTIIHLVIENIASLPVDFIELTFDDSSKSYYTQLLSDEELSAFEKYEAEHTLVHKPVFASTSTTKRQIGPGEECVLAVKCFGKADCTEGLIQVSYAYTHRMQNNLQEPSRFFYTRRLVFPVLVSIYQVLECSAMNIVPLPSVTAGSKHEEWQMLLKDRSRFDWCALTLDVQNTYGLPFEVTLSYNANVSSSQVIPPGATHRFLMPVKRICLPKEVTEAAIPSLTQRQFVVSGLASEDDKAQKELFWYREELLNELNATWKEAGGSRAGELSLRRQRFTQPMLETLRTEEVHVRLTLLGTQHTRDPSSLGSKPVAPNQDSRVLVEVVNSSPSNRLLTLTIDIDPVWHVIHTGLLKNIPLGRVASQAKSEHLAVFVFMAQGQYTLTARVKDIMLRQDLVLGKGSLDVMCLAS